MVMCRLFIPIILLLLLGCGDRFEYSPNQTFDRDSPYHLNQHNLKKLHTQSHDDTVVIAFIGDSQRFYDEVKQFVQKVNASDEYDFILIAGDISDFGLLQELEWVNDKLKYLKRPYFTVIGNHDVVGNGNATFEYFFGPINYSFSYGDYTFILHNTNGREYLGNQVPDLNWLHQQLHDVSTPYTIGVSHVPPFDGDFNKKLELTYAALLKSQSNFLVSLHGHQHRFSDGDPYRDGVRYITAPHFELRSFVKLTLIGKKVMVEKIPF